MYADAGLVDERKALMCRLEEAKGEADWRATGGFKTEDTAFALSQSYLILEMLQLLDHLGDDYESQLLHFNDKVGELEHFLNQAEEKFQLIRDHIADIIGAHRDDTY